MKTHSFSPAKLFAARCPILCLIKMIALMFRSRFVTVVYEDFHGIRRPIGLIHLVKVHGQNREVFTFCCASKRQPGMALFVRKRTGNLAEEVALSFDDQNAVPFYLKSMPELYKEERFKTFSMAS